MTKIELLYNAILSLYNKLDEQMARVEAFLESDTSKKWLRSRTGARLRGNLAGMRFILTEAMVGLDSDPEEQDGKLRVGDKTVEEHLKLINSLMRDLESLMDKSIAEMNKNFKGSIRYQINSFFYKLLLIFKEKTNDKSSTAL